MKPSDPALDRLAVAKKMLLDPYGLDEAKLQRSLASIFEHRADYADLYFQYTRSESYSLEEGIVKSGSFDIEQGVGVRAVVGDKTAFAYSDDISLDALAEAAVSAPRWSSMPQASCAGYQGQMYEKWQNSLVRLPLVPRASRIML